MFYFHICFVLFLCDPLFITIGIIEIGSLEEKRVLGSSRRKEKDGKFRVEKFNSQNYQLWKMKMEDYLYQKDIFLQLIGKEKWSMSMKDKEWEIIDRKSRETIRLFLEASVTFKISK
jgi:RecA-family ATPase